jgi:VanZ family protein
MTTPSFDPDSPSGAASSLSERRRTFWLFDAPVALYVVGILVVASLPGVPSLEMGFISADKFSHALAFLGMQILLQRALLRGHRLSTPRRAVLVSLAGAVAFGGFIEFYQLALPHRTAEWGDFLADGIGALFGAAWGIFRVRRHERS